jgi:hypothetical protein
LRCKEAKTGEKGEEDPVDIKLDFDALRHAVWMIAGMEQRER